MEARKQRREGEKDRAKGRTDKISARICPSDLLPTKVSSISIKNYHL
jgi:hypothetical protein